MLKYYNSQSSIKTTPKEQYRQDLQNLIDTELTNASTYFTIQQESATPTVYTDIDVRLTFPYSMNAMSTVKDDWRRIIFQNSDSTIVLGKKYKFNNFTWLTLDTGTMESPTNSCSVRRCNNVLKWISNGILKEEDCIFDEKINNMLNDNNNSIIIPDGTIYITIQKNSNTDSIIENQRFLLNGYAFKVTFVSKFNNVGNLIKLTLIKDQVDDSKDNLELGIANYYDNIIEEDIPNNVKINILSPQIYEILSGQYNKASYQINSYNNGTITNDTFTVSCSGLPNSAYILTVINGNNFTIQSNGYQSNKLHVTCTNVVDNTTLEFDIQLKDLW